jgi:hypothetical protein
VHLGPHAGRPCRRGEGERLAVGDALRIVAVVVKHVPHDRPADPRDQVEHVGEAEAAVVVLEDDPRPGRLRQPLEAAREAVETRAHAAGRPAHVQHDDRLRPEPHAVEDLGLHLELGDRQRGDPVVL